MKKKVYFITALCLVSNLPFYCAQPTSPKKTKPVAQQKIKLEGEALYGKVLEFNRDNKPQRTIIMLVRDRENDQQFSVDEIVSKIELKRKNNLVFHVDALYAKPDYRSQKYADFLFTIMRMYLNNKGIMKVEWYASPLDTWSGHEKSEMLPKLIEFYTNNGGKAEPSKTDPSLTALVLPKIKPTLDKNFRPHKETIGNTSQAVDTAVNNFMKSKDPWWILVMPPSPTK